MKNIKIIALGVWATVTFLGLICEAEDLDVFLLVKILSFVSAYACMKVCRRCEKSGLFKVEDDSPRF